MFRISTNVAALTSMRHLNKTSREITRTTERLSSGLRINRAADDAAAMFISESVRGQINTFKQANRNVAQATTLLQVMEGGLDQMTGILTRLKELAIQAADGAYSDAQRQKGIQVEADQLIDELNRLVAGISFNGITLFPSNDASITFQVGETEVDRVNLQLTRINANTMLDQFANKVGFIKSSTNLTSTFDVSATGAVSDPTTSGVLLQELKVGDLVRFSGLEYFVQSITDDDNAQLDMTLQGQISVTSGSATVTGAGTKFLKQLRANDTFTLNGTSYTVQSVDSDTQITLTAGAGETFTGTGTANLAGAAITGATVERADIAGQYLSIDAMQDFLNQIASGIETVISQRARLGAIQSRLERSAETNAIQVETATNAVSVIRDADMAEEISALVRAQILAQAGTSVLNQANLLPQNVLNLLGALG